MAFDLKKLLGATTGLGPQGRHGNADDAASGPAAFGARAHIVNRERLAESLAAPGSLDPQDLAPAQNPDVRRFLHRQRLELLLPRSWRFMGATNRSLSLSSDGTIEGHGIALSVWRLPNDLTSEGVLEGARAHFDEEVALGRVEELRPLRLGEIDGLLVVAWGPNDAAERARIDAEDPGALFLGTGGTGLRAVSWRGPVRRGDEQSLVIIAGTSPIETAYEARPLYDAMLASARIVISA